jgi:hypothetical protein
VQLPLRISPAPAYTCQRSRSIRGFRYMPPTRTMPVQRYRLLCSTPSPSSATTTA